MHSARDLYGLARRLFCVGGARPKMPFTPRKASRGTSGICLHNLLQVIPVVLTALFYDEKSGDCNFGSNVRDAACYCCWAFARAYKAADFACHMQEVSQKLILSALFDRELNVRRAAAAAFQENVGRQVRLLFCLSE